MHTRLILIMLFLLQFMPGMSLAKQTEWKLNYISDVDVFGKHEPNVIRMLNETYSKVSIIISQNDLSVIDVSKGELCAAKYIEIPTNPLAYFLSGRTVELYSQLLKHENQTLPDEFSVITSRVPLEECRIIYQEIIKIKDKLILIDKGHMLFFTIISDSTPGNEKSNPDTFSTYCHDLNPGKEFDGSSEHMCKFEGMALEPAYKKIASLSYIGQDYFKDELPVADVKYSIKEKMVTYHRTENTLNILVDSENESFNYVFTVHPSGTIVKITDETQY